MCFHYDSPKKCYVVERLSASFEYCMIIHDLFASKSSTYFSRAYTYSIQLGYAVLIGLLESKGIGLGTISFLDISFHPATL